MDKETQKARKRVIILFCIFLLIAIACFAGCAYMMQLPHGTEVENRRIVQVAQIFVFTGIFFLVIDFGYAFPRIIGGRKNAPVKENDIFQEVNMRRAFEKYTPDGETLIAGIHAIANESSVIMTYKNCISTDYTLEPAENGQIVELTKTKYSAYDVYVGITQNSLLITQCEENKYAYSIENRADSGNPDIPELLESIAHKELGHCFLLSDIKSTELKKGMMGAIKCNITLKNGSYFKMLLPANGGLGYGMPHHAKYRDILLSKLNTYTDEKYMK